MSCDLCIRLQGWVLSYNQKVFLLFFCLIYDLWIWFLEMIYDLWMGKVIFGHVLPLSLPLDSH